MTINICSYITINKLPAKYYEWSSNRSVTSPSGYTHLDPQDLGIKWSVSNDIRVRNEQANPNEESCCQQKRPIRK